MNCKGISGGSIIRKKSSGLNKSHKEVTFSDKLVEVIEFKDDPESQDSRNLHWELLARDRLSFKTRIYEVAIVLSPILTEAHRTKIYDNIQKFTVTATKTSEILRSQPFSKSTPPSSNYQISTAKTSNNKGPLDTNTCENIPIILPLRPSTFKQSPTKFGKPLMKI